jgi:hypothetical protein
MIEGYLEVEDACKLLVHHTPTDTYPERVYT